MKWILDRQSELSATSAIFFAVGAIFPLFFATVFHTEHQPANSTLFTVAGLSAATAALALILGARFTVLLAGISMTAAALLILLLVLWTPLELRALNIGMIFTTVFIYLVWFMPFWFARALTYPWLALYCIIMVIKFSVDVRPLMMTLVVSTVVLGELIGRFKRRIEDTSLTDVLCEVWNQRGFRLILGRALGSTVRSGNPLSVLYIDLDGFKAINDSRGHAEGDRVLREFTQALGILIRPQDALARIGGDEFAVILPDTDEESARLVGERLREQVAIVGWSFGVAEWRQGEDAEQFIARADALMMQEKRLRKSARIAAASLEA